MMTGRILCGDLQIIWEVWDVAHTYSTFSCRLRDLTCLQIENEGMPRLHLNVSS